MPRTRSSVALTAGRVSGDRFGRGPAGDAGSLLHRPRYRLPAGQGSV